jgi:23S rRNA U2552 (ribose-2'-O)-methylase RlmE/FtsJ
LQRGRVVDVVLSDMCAPFPGLELSSWVNSVNRPYRRMMNTSGNPFRDHAGSIVRLSQEPRWTRRRRRRRRRRRSRREVMILVLT